MEAKATDAVPEAAAATTTLAAPLVPAAAPAASTAGPAAGASDGQSFPTNTEQLFMVVSHALRAPADELKSAHSEENDNGNDKVRNRKTNHSAIERRRRDRINEKINSLRSLVPTCANQENLHKVSILEKVVEYIQGLVRDNEQLKRDVQTAKVESTRYREKLEAAQPAGDAAEKTTDVEMKQ